MAEIATRTPDDATVVLSVSLRAEPTRVYRAFTDPALLARWWWPKSLAATYQVDPVVNGAFRVRGTTQEIGIEATFREVVPNERIRLDWQWDFDPTVTQVVAELAAEDGGTRLTVTHGHNPGILSREEHLVGWRDCLSRLVALDATGQLST